MPTVRGARAWILSSVAVAGLAALTQAQSRVTDAMLARKKAFAEQQLAALAQPFVGVHSTAGVTPGLFPIRASGVSTAPIVQAADAFLATLTAGADASARSSPPTPTNGGAGPTSTTASTRVRA